MRFCQANTMLTTVYQVLREYAVMLEVNTNTAVKAYDLLAREEIIYNKRGLAQFLFRPVRTTRSWRRARKISSHTLPDVFRTNATAGYRHQRSGKEWEKQ